MVQTERLKRLLQPDVVLELGKLVSGPLDLLHLKEQLDRRRQSQGDTLAVAEPTIERLIQFKPETWEALNQLAEQLEAQGACVTPAQVAALLIESSLANRESEARE
jgi:hypothetical protein